MTAVVLFSSDTCNNKKWCFEQLRRLTDLTHRSFIVKTFIKKNITHICITLRITIFHLHLHKGLLKPLKGSSLENVACFAISDVKPPQI